MERENKERERKGNFPKKQGNSVRGTEHRRCGRLRSIKVDQRSLIATGKGVHSKGTTMIGWEGGSAGPPGVYKGLQWAWELRVRDGARTT